MKMKKKKKIDKWKRRGLDVHWEQPHTQLTSSKCKLRRLQEIQPTLRGSKCIHFICC